jgi:hypothetical protein
LSNCAWKGSAVSEGGADDDDKMLRPGAHGLCCVSACKFDPVRRGIGVQL